MEMFSLKLFLLLKNRNVKKNHHLNLIFLKIFQVKKKKSISFKGLYVKWAIFSRKKVLWPENVPKPQMLLMFILGQWHIY